MYSESVYREKRSNFHPIGGLKSGLDKIRNAPIYNSVMEDNGKKIRFYDLDTIRDVLLASPHLSEIEKECVHVVDSATEWKEVKPTGRYLDLRPSSSAD